MHACKYLNRRQLVCNSLVAALPSRQMVPRATGAYPSGQTRRRLLHECQSSRAKHVRPNLANYIQNLQASYATLSEVSPEAQRLLEMGNSGTYARFGWDDRRGHAVGLRIGSLRCPSLDKVFKCASTSPTLLISPDFWSGEEPVSKEFVSRVEHLLQESYSCDAAVLRACMRRGD